MNMEFKNLVQDYFLHIIWVANVNFKAAFTLTTFKTEVIQVSSDFV